MSIELSRSEQKRRIRAVEELVRELAVLPRQEMLKLPCEHDVIDLLLEAQDLKGGTLKRHIKYITKLLKNRSNSELYGFIDRKKRVSLKQKKDFQELEYLRDRLLNEAIDRRTILRREQQDLDELWPSKTIEEIQQLFPAIDTVALSRLSSIFARTRQPRHSREIFRLLKAAQEQAARNAQSETI